MSAQVIELAALPKLPDGWMYEVNSLPQAEQVAAENSQPFIWHFPGNGKYYVAKSEQVTA
jgi:hypothetical protein